MIDDEEEVPIAMHCGVPAETLRFFSSTQEMEKRGKRKPSYYGLECHRCGRVAVATSSKETAERFKRL